MKSSVKKSKLFIERLLGYDTLQSNLDAIFCYPYIPSRGINPWDKRYTDLINQKTSMLHLRTRDFEDIFQLENFLMKSKLENHYVLLVFGDLFPYNGSPKSELQPWQALDVVKKYFPKVGVVVNPTPIVRSVAEELKSFELKLGKNPDFIVTQCVYDLATALGFLKISQIPKDKLYMNLGYWQGVDFEKLGIHNLQKLTSPPTDIVNYAKEQCAGIYVCGNCVPLDFL